MMHEVEIPCDLCEQIRDNRAQGYARFFDDRFVRRLPSQRRIAPAGEQRRERRIGFLRRRLWIEAAAFNELREVPLTIVGELLSQFLARDEERKLAQDVRDPRATRDVQSPVFHQVVFDVFEKVGLNRQSNKECGNFSRFAR
jgi:hypothetical protein